MQLTNISSSEFFQTVLGLNLFQGKDKHNSLWMDFEKVTFSNLWSSILDWLASRAVDHKRKSFSHAKSSLFVILIDCSRPNKQLVHTYCQNQQLIVNHPDYFFFSNEWLKSPRLANNSSWFDNLYFSTVVYVIMTTTEFFIARKKFKQAWSQLH